MQDFFTKNERILLDQYQNQINCKNFLLNFIKQNPLNYPITSSIISKLNNSKNNIKTVRSLFIDIDSKFEDYINPHNEILVKITRESIINRKISFINLVVLVLYSELTNVINIINKNNQNFLIILKGYDCYEVIDSKCSQILLFKIADYQNIIELANNPEIVDFETFKIETDKVVQKYYDFKLNEINDIFIQRIIILSFISGVRFYVNYQGTKTPVPAEIIRILQSLDMYCTIGYLIKNSFINSFVIENKITYRQVSSEVPEFEGSEIQVY